MAGVAASQSIRRAIPVWRSSLGWAARSLLLGSLLSLSTGLAGASPLPIATFAQLAHQCAGNVAVSTLAAVVGAESGFEPWSLHDNTVQLDGVPQSAADAASIATRLIAVGHSVDIGLMQVNSANLPALGLTVEQALDPCRSIAAGAAILTENYSGGETHAAQQAALRVAISRYNTGDDERGFANGYVRKVELSNARVVPALDLEPGVTTSPLPAPIAAEPRPAATPGAPPSWEVFPPEDASTSPKSAAIVQGPDTGPGALTVADAGRGPAAAVKDYPGPSQTNIGEAP